MLLTGVCAVALAILPLVCASGINTKKNNAPSFVMTKNNQFFSDGKPFPFTSANAYWLHQLDDVDLENTFSSIGTSGVKVITTLAYDDVVDQPPPFGAPYFQLFQGDKITVNEAGLQRLDTVVKLAEHYELKLMLTLTGNWYPSTKGVPNPKPHGFLSNSYGGADVYVQQLSTSGFHDSFYTDPTIINAFKNYVKTIVTRYVNSTAIFSWQIMDDPQCASTLPASPSCSAQTLATWHDDIYKFIKSIDCNHLIGTGDTWFYNEAAPVYPTKRGGASLRAILARMIKTTRVSTRATPAMDWGGSQLVAQPGVGGMSYRRGDPTQQVIDSGTAFIGQQAANAATWGIPIMLTGFGVVSQSSVACFTPRDSSTVVVPPPGSYIPTDKEQGQIYAAWLAETRNKGFGGTVLYQWNQTCLAKVGTNPIIINENSPNDGYTASPDALAAVELNVQLQA
ncbi:glycoside hydrolase family 5 protein [Botryobasidium botryosum FD-172 SS1]|uniref:mannan endo-1,4-beta-mannosidase n=1 Tax=Botryobasidium botryosum (strain FD-172 SS1) TaxID=930990 RepID=A0A067M6K1_BOTB1|nr:glycoside hydrolase family 5 protein [Botryobasidium botryosum FD-172 SS1]